MLQTFVLRHSELDLKFSFPLLLPRSRRSNKMSSTDLNLLSLQTAVTYDEKMRPRWTSLCNRFRKFSVKNIGRVRIIVGRCSGMFGTSTDDKINMCRLDL